MNDSGGLTGILTSLIITVVILNTSYSQGVGINNDGSAPVAGIMLEVKGTTDDNTAHGLQVKNNSGTTLFDVLNDGNVGIGTASPANLLDVSVNSTTNPSTGGLKGIGLVNADLTANSLSGILFRSYDDGGNGRHGGAIVAGKTSNWIGGSGNYPGFLSFWTRPFTGNQAEHMRITDVGNVGIGTTSPSEKLDVVGNIEVSGSIEPGGLPGSSGQVLTSGGAGVTATWTTPTTGDITGVTAGTGLTGGGTSGAVTLGIHTATDDDISNRAPSVTGLGSGFYQSSTVTTAEGWPENASWFHLINVQHSNTANNFAMQLAADYYDQQLYFRSTNDNGSQAWGEVWHSLSDGVGSGLDADILDGVSSGSFLRSDASDNYSGGLLRTYSATSIDVTNTGQINGLQAYQPTANADALITFHIAGDYAVHFGLDGNTNDLTVGGWSMGANKYKVWHAGNDGSGSGLDADLLDGVSSGSFIRSDVDDLVQGTLDFDPTTTIGSTGLYGFQMSRGANWNGIVIDGSLSTKSLGIHYGGATDNTLRFGRYADNFGTWEANVTTLDIDNGNLYTLGTFEADGRIYGDNGVHVRADWLRVDGNRGVYFQSWGGGFYMSDATWIRTYNNKSFYHNTGTMRTDGTFQVGGSGATLNVPNGGNFAYRTNVLFANTLGNVGIGTTSPTQKLEVNGRLKTNGVNETSDIRFKKRIKPIENALSRLMKINGVTYLWRTRKFPERNFQKDRQIGVIAQEIECIIPEVVDTDNEGYKSVDYSHMVPLLIEAIKELKGQLEVEKAINSHQSALIQTFLGTGNSAQKLNRKQTISLGL